MNSGPPARAFWPWAGAALLIAIAVAIGLRLGTNILDRGNTFDEQYIRIPIEDLIHKGWSIKTAIDFTESKGPSFIWSYALLGEALGGSLNDLRLMTAAFFVLGIIPLLLICRMCGIGGWRMLAAAAFYILIPQHAVLGQLLMSEPSFIFGGLWLLWAFMWGFGRTAAEERRVAGPIIFGLILSVMLHHRIHAVAFAGAAALVAFQRDRARSWPWWLACALAGLTRIPLWVRWGGLVSPAYQQMHSLGVRLDSLTYLAASLVPLTIAFLWSGLTDPQARRNWWMLALGALIGLALALGSRVDLERTIAVVIPGEQFEGFVFLGFAGTLAKSLASSPGAQSAIIGAMAVVGLSSLGALAALCIGRSFHDRTSVALRLQVWTLLSGWALYGLTQGFVFDRFMMAWAVLMPIAWAAALPRWLQAVQLVALASMLAWWTRDYLM